MSAQDVILGARVARVRELTAEIARLKAENAALRAEAASLSAHFATALVAAEDLRSLPPGGKLIVVDGWNLVLGAGKVAHDRGELVEKAERHVAENMLDFVWIVFDGPGESVSRDGRVRVSYTGGTGAQRADRFICDFLRMAAYVGGLGRIEVRTHDKALVSEIGKIRKINGKVRRP